jgi:hypothetical protein
MLNFSQKEELENLPVEELIVIAGEHGLEIPANLEKQFVIEEILLAQTEKKAAKDVALLLDDETGVFEIESSPLPAAYCKTYIETRIRDPLWIFVFWEIRDADKEAIESLPGFAGFCLRVRPASGISAGGGNIEEYTFSIPVRGDDTSWYLDFPGQSDAFQIELCYIQNGRELTMCAAGPCSLPKLLPKSGDGGAHLRNPLALLSGLDELSVLRSTTSSSRMLHVFESKQKK